MIFYTNEFESRVGGQTGAEKQGFFEGTFLLFSNVLGLVDLGDDPLPSGRVGKMVIVRF